MNMIVKVVEVERCLVSGYIQNIDDMIAKYHAIAIVNRAAKKYL